MKISMRRSSGAAIALTSLLALGACSSGGSTDSNASQGDTVDAGDLAQGMVEAMEKAGSGRMVTDPGGEKATGDFKYVDGKLEQRSSVSVEGSQLDIVAVGDFVYIKGLPEQKTPWVKIDPKDSDPISQLFKGFADGGVSDPHRMANNLKGTKATVKSKDGDNTTYAFTVDSAKALGQAAPTATPAPSASSQQLSMTYVIDKDGRPVVLTTSAGSETIKVSYSDWGKKVDIDVPADDQLGPITVPSVPAAPSAPAG